MAEVGKYTVNILKGDFIVIEQGNYIRYENNIRELDENIDKLSSVLESIVPTNSSSDVLNELSLYKNYITDIMTNNTVDRGKIIEINNFLEAMQNQSSNIFKKLSKTKEADDILNWFVTGAAPVISYLASIIG